MNNDLEYRMYGLVPYNISPIQQAIQYGHALQEYNNLFFKEFFNDKWKGEKKSEDFYKFQKWAKEDKTFIILNGGTTNSSSTTPDEDVGPYPEYKGTLNNYEMELMEHGIKYATFHEPDLNNALTAIVFLVDERVWNKEKYPDYSYELSDLFINLLKDTPLSDSQKEYIETMGGEKNIWLRNFISQFKLA